MDKKKTSIILIILSSLLCGIPGLAAFCLGSMSILGSLIPTSDLTQADSKMAFIGGIIIVFLGLILVATPILAWLLTRNTNNQRETSSEGVIPEEDF